ncbi:MAG: 6-pyruvoyl-tetrahydropterin synthase-related protein [Candidatus Levyibacteriota bacterium]
MARFLKFKYILLVLIISFFSVLALLPHGLLPTHDGEYHVIRFYEFDKVLRDGNFYPRWAPDLNNGFGVPLFNYVYPLPNYFASLLHLFGISFIDSFKLNMFFASIFGTIFFYLWTRRFWGNLGGVVSCAFYSFSPYRFVDVYIRGSVGEIWALAFFPAFLWSITNFIKTKSMKDFVLSSLFLSALIFSHNILALMFFFFSMSYVAFLILKEENKKDVVLKILLIIFLGLGLSSIFWLPAVLETKFVTGLQIYNVKENFPDLFALLIPSWGSGFSGGSLQNQMSFQIGIANLFAVFSSVIILVLSIRKKAEYKSSIFFFLTWFVITFFLMLKTSLPIWEKVPFMDYFQFPWRFLSLEIVVASFLAGSIVKAHKPKLLAAFFIILVFLLGIGYAKPAYYFNRDDNYYVTRSNFIDGTNSPGNFFNTIWMNNQLAKQKEKIILKKEDGEINSFKIKSTIYEFNVFIKKDLKIAVNTAYFPGWIATVDGRNVETFYDKDGLLTFSVPKGNHNIMVRFSETPIRKIALVWTLTSICLLALFGVSRYVKIKK